MKKIVLISVCLLLVYFGMSQTSKLYVFSPWYYGCDLFKQELPADMYKSNATINYQSALPPKHYTYIELEEGDLAIVNGRKFKVEANKAYYFDLLRSTFLDEKKGEKLKKSYKYKEPILIDGGGIALAQQNTSTQTGKSSISLSEPRNSDVDVNVPVTDKKNSNTFVLIIANENYEFVDDVQFALNDGEAFKEYCVKTLGIPERQIFFFKNASAGIISSGVSKMVQAMDIFDGAKAIVYYCGHGIPEEKTGNAYIVPTDGKGTDVASCYSLNKLYKTLSNSKASSVTYFMDACFTGANRDGSMLVAARGVAREAKKEMIEGNTVVFSAASGDETAMPYKEKQHGLFTYFLLKKIQETKGEVSYGELADYIRSNVKKEAFLTNEKPQNPVIATSEKSQNTWKSIKLK